MKTTILIFLGHKYLVHEQKTKTLFMELNIPTPQLRLSLVRTSWKFLFLNISDKMPLMSLPLRIQKYSD